MSQAPSLHAITWCHFLFGATLVNICSLALWSSNASCNIEHPAQSCECRTEVIPHMLGEEPPRRGPRQRILHSVSTLGVGLRLLSYDSWTCFVVKEHGRTAQTPPGHGDGFRSGSRFVRWHGCHPCPSAGIFPQHYSHSQAGWAEQPELWAQGGLAPPEAIYPILPHQRHDFGPRLPHAGHHFWRTLQRPSVFCEVQWALAPACSRQAGPFRTSQDAWKCPLLIPGQNDCWTTQKQWDNLKNNLNINKDYVTSPVDHTCVRNLYFFLPLLMSWFWL